MLVVFRTDASVKIGIGHLMRCLTLAEEIAKRNGKILFILKEYENWILEKIKITGFNYKLISKNVRNQQDDLIASSNAISSFFEKNVDWLIVDHYGLSREWEEGITEISKKIMVIDDLANRSHRCDLLLDQNYFPNLKNRYDHLLDIKCVKLLGPKYALLRKEFDTQYQLRKERDGHIKNILVFFGGSDEPNLSEKTLLALQNVHKGSFLVDMIVGGNNPHVERIEALVKKMKNVTLHVQVSNMAELMNRADIAIGAGGATTWERCILGLPSLTINFAENQVKTSNYLHSLGAIDLLGWAEHITPSEISSAIEHYQNNPDALLALSKNAAKVLFDWVGTKAVVDTMMTISE